MSEGCREPGVIFWGDESCLGLKQQDRGAKKYLLQVFVVQGVGRGCKTGQSAEESARTTSMMVTSGGARKRIGGPHVPVPLLTYREERFPTSA